MGSKKLKRKKLKCKKLEKLYKLKAKRPKKSILFKSYKETEREKSISDGRLSPKKCSRSNVGEDNNADVKHFAKVRENYFRYLQTVISNNCEFFDSAVTEEMLESLALELEQNALLACLQVEVYRRSMLKIIEAISVSTKEKQVHKDVKKLLSDSLPEKAHQIDSPKSPANSQEVETYSKIPTIAFSRTENNLEADSLWANESIYNAESYYPVTNHCNGYSDQTELQLNSNVQIWGEDNMSLNPNEQNNWNNESPQPSDLTTFQNVVPSHSPILQNTVENHTLITTPNQNEDKYDPLSLSRNQLQKLVEQTLDETEKANKQKRDEQDRAYLARIFEGDDSLEQTFNDSLSDNENESKENIDDSNLMDRLEKMRELFGMEDEETQPEILAEKPKKTCKVSQAPIRSRRPTIWRYEKFIQLHKLSIIASEMTDERRQYNQKLFIQLFGEDSDEEHEMEFSSTEKYRSSCTERISSWVVKYLMPFYHDKRILGRNVFKSLGHYISDTIVDEIQYPDEWTVKYFVSKFFPPKKKYVCDADFLNFELD